MGTPLRYFRLAREFARIGVIRKTQFRVEFLCQVVMDAMWYLVHVATFEILFAHTTHIAGWEREDVRVWLGQSWHFGGELKDGALDSLRLRPGSPIFLYFFQRFSLEAAVNAVLALAWLLYALAGIEGAFTLGGLAMLAWATLLAFWARTVLSVLFTITEFYAVNSDLSNVAWEVSMTVADRPADVFPMRLRQFLTSLVPVAAISTLPAAMVLGRLTLLECALHSLWLMALGMGVFRWWRRSFRRYTSAMG
jgi:ABC-2 type transport system permease protein